MHVAARLGHEPHVNEEVVERLCLLPVSKNRILVLCLCIDFVIFFAIVLSWPLSSTAEATAAVVRPQPWNVPVADTAAFIAAALSRDSVKETQSGL